MRTHTSKRLSYDEMSQILDMLNVTPFLLEEANELGHSSIAMFTVRKTGLEQLFTLTIIFA